MTRAHARIEKARQNMVNIWQDSPLRTEESREQKSNNSYSNNILGVGSPLEAIKGSTVTNFDMVENSEPGNASLMPALLLV